VVKIRKSKERGFAEHGWLQSYHTFSFADYYDPNHMGFGSLRVINQDTIAAQSGFPTHPHRDMEIITYVYRGVLEHRDSLGNIGQIHHGEIQRMSAGTGIRHSEYNPSKTEVTELLQIWIQPSQMNVPPSYEQIDLKEELKIQNWVLLASKDNSRSTARISQDAEIFVGRFAQETKFILPLAIIHILKHQRIF
jgi:redox-sensitive bicupin YhaK (pirin superfamily)